MPTGRVIEEGVINGISYRKWKAWGSGKVYYYTGRGRGGRGKRHGRGWLNKQRRKQKKEREEDEQAK